MFNIEKGQKEISFLSIKNAVDAIKEPVKIKNIEWKDSETTSKGNQLGERMEITVEIEGNKVTTSYFAENPYKSQEDHNKKLAPIFMNIGHRFLGEEFSLKVPTFKEAVEKTIADTKSKWESTDLRAFFIYDKNFVKLRKFAPIFEDLSVPLANTKLIAGQYDVITKPVVAKTTPDIELEDEPKNDLGF